MTYAIEFNFPEGTAYAGMYKDALGWAPTIASALLYDDEESALRVMENGYGNMRRYARIVAVRARP